jgi:predicted N-acetyltransferase YhbS
MTIEFRPPRPDEEPALRSLFTEAFGDAAFTDLFFQAGFSPARCLTAVDETILAALHWFDCTLEGQRAAYIYGIATFEAHRGLGIGSQLIRAALTHLKQEGCGPVFLVPAEPSLFGYYERFGFRAVSTIQESSVTAAAPLPIRHLDPAEYADLRRAYLPAHSLIQEGACLALLDGYAKLYATDHAVAAVTEGMVWELLGDFSDAPGLIAALGLPQATVRTPGTGRPFAMGLHTEKTVYLGLALD